MVRLHEIVAQRECHNLRDRITRTYFFGRSNCLLYLPLRQSPADVSFTCVSFRAQRYIEPADEIQILVYLFFADRSLLSNSAYRRIDIPRFIGSTPSTLEARVAEIIFVFAQTSRWSFSLPRIPFCRARASPSTQG